MNIMTIHAAKGLEFSVVFVAALNRGGSGKARRYARFEGAGTGREVAASGNGEGSEGCGACGAQRETAAGDENAEKAAVVCGHDASEDRLVLSFSTRQVVGGAGEAGGEDYAGGERDLS